MFKVNNNETRKTLVSSFTPFSRVSIVVFEHAFICWVWPNFIYCSSTSTSALVFTAKNWKALKQTQLTLTCSKQH